MLIEPEEDQFTIECSAFLNENYPKTKLAVNYTNPNSLLKAFYETEVDLKEKLRAKYKDDPQLKRKAISLLYSKLNREFNSFTYSFDINKAIRESNSSLCENQAFSSLPTQEQISLYKSNFLIQIEKKFTKPCPKFLLKENLEKMKKNYSLKPLPQAEEVKDFQLRWLNEILKIMQKTKTLPIDIDEAHFDLFILSNCSYFNKDKPFAWNFLMNNFKLFSSIFNLTGLTSSNQFNQKVMSLIQLDDTAISTTLTSLHKKIITKDNILNVICTFTLLFNSIISLNPNRTISFISTSFITQNRLKQLLYNFIKAIASTMLPEWYALVRYIQGPLISDYVKENSYPNRGVIAIEEMDQLLQSSPLKSSYLKFVEKKQIKAIKGKLVGFLVDLFSKETDLSTVSLTPLNPNTQSTTCNIMISGFLSEVDNLENNWQGIIKAINSNEACYFYRWPSQTTKMVTTRVIGKTAASVILNKFGMKGFDKETPEKQFLISKATSKNAGKLLAFIIASRQLFKHQTINLIGFSLGVNVIKNCIKQLYKIHTEMKIACDDIIQNVLMLAGASVIKDRRKKEYAEYYNTIASGRVLNCYSHKDQVLNILFEVATKKQPIGNRKLDMPLAKLENYDFTDLKLGHMDYKDNFEVIVKRIAFNN